MASNTGQYVPTPVGYLRIRENLHSAFGAAVSFAYSRFGRVGRERAPLPAPQKGAAALNPARTESPVYGNEAKRRFLY